MSRISPFMQPGPLTRIAEKQDAEAAKDDIPADLFTAWRLLMTSIGVTSRASLNNAVHVSGRMNNVVR